jgi:hypothetical protein
VDAVYKIAPSVALKYIYESVHSILSRGSFPTLDSMTELELAIYLIYIYAEISTSSTVDFKKKEEFGVLEQLLIALITHNSKIIDMF